MHRAVPTSTPGPGQPLARVTAILVCHDGAAFLPRTLAAVDGQTRPPDRLVAVDTGSADTSPDLLTGTGGQVLRLPRSTSFGDAVGAVLAALDVTRLTQASEPRPPDGLNGDPGGPGGAGGRGGPEGSGVAGDDGAAGRAADRVPEWLWLLHDDSAPAPDALERLLAAVDAGPSIAIAGCKQVAWDDSRRLIDVGFTTSRFGARVTGVDTGDLDQGQLDHRSDVLAVGTAGMLVRRDVWDTLGGPDPALVHVRDDLDLCRRAHQAGHRVVVVPSAVVAHATATATRRRGLGHRPSWHRQDRRDAVYLRLAATPWPLLPLVVLWTTAATVLRALAALALKQPERAGAEVMALGLTLLRPGSWLRARRRAESSRRIPRRAFRRLLASSRQSARQRRDTLSAYLRTQEEAWAAAETSRRPSTGATALSAATQGGSRGPAAAPGGVTTSGAAPSDAARSGATPAAAPGGVTPSGGAARGADRPAETRSGGPSSFAVAAAVAGAALVVAVIGLRGVLRGTGAVAGPALLPVPEATALWRTATSPWRPVGLGASAVPDPLTTLVAAVAAVLGGSAHAAVVLLLITALPLAALASWWAAGALTRSRALRTWAALAWSGAPPFLLALADGRLGAVLAHVVLPLAALALARSVTPAARLGSRVTRRRPRGSVAAASGAGLLLSMVLAGAPALAVPCVVMLLAVAAIAPTRRGVVAWTAAVPAVLLLPWWVAVAAEPRLLLAEPGGPSSRTPGGGPWHLALFPADPAGFVAGPAGAVARALAAIPPMPFAGPADALRVLVAAGAVPLTVLAVAGLLRRSRGRWVATLLLWVAGLTGLAVAGLAPIVDVAATADGARYGWAGPGLSLFALGLVGAALHRCDGVAIRLRSRAVGWRHGVTVVAGIVAVVAPVAGLAVWSWQGWTAGPEVLRVRRIDADVLPAVAVAEAQGPAATRTLVLRVSADGVRWTIARDGGPRFGDTSAALAADAAGPVRGAGDARAVAAIGGLLSDTGRDERERLADLGIGSVLLLPPLDDAALLALDTAPGLLRVAAPEGAVLWRVELDPAGEGPSRPARVRVLGADGAALAALPSDGASVHARLPSGPRGRTLVLAERADAGWHAALDGRRLEPRVHAGWAQAFELPAAGGRLTVEHRAPARRGVDAVRLTVAALALLVAVPLPRHRPRLRPPPRTRGRHGALTPLAPAEHHRADLHRPATQDPVIAGDRLTEAVPVSDCQPVTEGQPATEVGAGTEVAAPTEQDPVTAAAERPIDLAALEGTGDDGEAAGATAAIDVAAAGGADTAVAAIPPARRPDRDEATPAGQGLMSDPATGDGA